MYIGNQYNQKHQCNSKHSHNRKRFVLVSHIRLCMDLQQNHLLKKYTPNIFIFPSSYSSLSESKEVLPLLDK